MTGKTCGVHDTVQEYCNTAYNACHLYEIRGTNLTQEGDSGGPVFYGGYALGWVHGYDSTGMLYTAVDDFRKAQSSLDIIVYK